MCLVPALKISTYLCRHSQLLFPTLISACYQVDTNKELLEQEISCKLLVAFLESNIQEISTESGTRNKYPTKGQAAKGQEKTSATSGQTQIIVDHGSLFEHRFPKSHWKDAVSFFSR